MHSCWKGEEWERSSRDTDHLELSRSCTFDYTSTAFCEMLLRELIWLKPSFLIVHFEPLFWGKEVVSLQGGQVLNNSVDAVVQLREQHAASWAQKGRLSSHCGEMHWAVEPQCRRACRTGVWSWCPGKTLILETPYCLITVWCWHMCSLYQSWVLASLSVAKSRDKFMWRFLIFPHLSQPPGTCRIGNGWWDQNGEFEGGGNLQIPETLLTPFITGGNSIVMLCGYWSDSMRWLHAFLLAGDAWPFVKY